MQYTLPTVRTLILDTWNTFKKHLEDLQRFIYPLLIGSFIYSLIQFFLLRSANTLALHITLVCMYIAFIFWYAIRLMQALLQIEAGQKITFNTKSTSQAKKSIPSLLFIAFFQELIILGGFFLFVIPGIYFGIALSFSSFIHLETQKKGFNALGASRDLVRNKWWAIFWRQCVFGFVCSSVYFILLEMSKIISSESTIFVSNILSAFILPLNLIFHVKLYTALKKSSL